MTETLERGEFDPSSGMITAGEAIAEHLPPVDPPPATARRPLAERVLPPTHHTSRFGGFAIFVIFFTLYLIIGLWLNLHNNWLWGDALSRVADGSYVVFSRFPHIAAVGFVWNPLPSILEIPIIMFRGIWDPLMSRGIAAVILTAGFAAGSVVQIRGICVDRGIPKLARWFITLAFGLHPMIMLYSANGMTEMIQIFFIVWAVRAMMRWVNSDHTTDLISAAIALALAYMTRYESAAVAFGAMVAVMIISWVKEADRPHQARRADAIIDGLTVTFPFIVAFIGWAIASWIITGAPFQQFTSNYGNGTQSKALTVPGGYGGVNRLVGSPFLLPPRNIEALEILLPAIVAFALILAWHRKDLTVLPVCFTCGAALSFFALTYVMKLTFPWLRFYMLSIPLAVILVITLFPDQRAEHPEAKRGPLIWVSMLAAVILLVPAMPVAWFSMLNPTIGLQEHPLRSVVNPTKYPPTQEPDLQAPWAQVAIANYIDSMHLPEGSVLVDTFSGWQIFLAAKDNKAFVITSDYDFVRDLNDPSHYGVHYVLVPGVPQAWPENAVNLRYPDFWYNGAGIATEVLYAPPIGSQPAWKLFVVNSS